MGIHLTSEQRIALEMLHKSSRDCRMRDRIRCVLLAADDWTTSMIAKSQLIDETAVRRHLHDWLNDEKLKPENGGSASHLNEVQTTELIVYLTDYLLPTTQAIIEKVGEWWGIRYTVPGMNKWLYRNDFCYKKPTGVPHKFSSEAQQAFVESDNQLKSEVGDEHILIIDGVHPTQGTKLSYGWMPKSVINVVKTTGSRTCLNIMDALNLSDIGSTVIREYGSINSLSIAQFFMGI